MGGWGERERAAGRGRAGGRARWEGGGPLSLGLCNEEVLCSSFPFPCRVPETGSRSVSGWQQPGRPRGDRRRVAVQGPSSAWLCRSCGEGTGPARGDPHPPWSPAGTMATSPAPRPRSCSPGPARTGASSCAPASPSPGRTRSACCEYRALPTPAHPCSSALAWPLLPRHGGDGGATQ